MTVNYPAAFNRSPSAGFDGVFDWDFLKPAFSPTKIMPMDFDGVVERGGRFLCFETKSGIVPIPQGQVLTLKALVETGRWTIIVLRGKCAAEVDGWDVWFRGQRSGLFEQRHEDGDADALVEFVRRWFQKASQVSA